MGFGTSGSSAPGLFERNRSIAATSGPNCAFMSGL